MNISSVGNPAAVLFDKKKGDAGNRFACAAELAGNEFKSGFQATAVVGTAGAAIAVMKMPKLTEKALNILGKSKAFIKEHTPQALKEFSSKVKTKIPTEVKTFLKEGLAFLKKNKVAAVIIAAGTVLAGVAANSKYKAGRIEQKYEDRAVFSDPRSEYVEHRPHHDD